MPKGIKHVFTLWTTIAIACGNDENLAEATDAARTINVVTAANFSNGVSPQHAELLCSRWGYRPNPGSSVRLNVVHHLKSSSHQSGGALRDTGSSIAIPPGSTDQQMHKSPNIKQILFLNGMPHKFSSPVWSSSCLRGQVWFSCNSILWHKNRSLWHKNLKSGPGRHVPCMSCMRVMHACLAGHVCSGSFMLVMPVMHAACHFCMS
jgi:hypothetical protein